MPVWLITLRNLVITQLKGEAVKRLSIIIFKSASLSGFRGWLIKTIVTNFSEEIAEPIIKASFIKLNYVYTKAEGKILIKKLKDTNNENDYDTIIDDIYN